MLATSVEQWDYPLSREAAILADMWDLSYAKAGAKKRERYPRPFKQNDTTVQTFGKKKPVFSRDEVVAILNANGHTLS